MSDDAGHKSAVEQGVIDRQDTAHSSRSEKEQQKAAADFAREKTAAGQTMRIKVYSPFRSYYDGQALSISAVNDTGPFDILPKHHNFISLLNQCDLVVRTGKAGDKKIIISGGVMHVKADQVIVFLDV